MWYLVETVINNGSTGYLESHEVPDLHETTGARPQSISQHGFSVIKHLGTYYSVEISTD